MAVSEAIAGFGTRLLKGDGGSPEAFTDIAEVHDIDGPGLNLGTTEVTHHLSPDAFKEYLATLKDMDDLSFEIAYVPSNATHDTSTGLIADLNNRTRRNFQVIFTDSTVWDFAGFVTGFKVSGALENALLANVTIRPTGGIAES